jgi:hypothetical protein
VKGADAAPNTDSNADADANTNSNTYADPNTDANTDANNTTTTSLGVARKTTPGNKYWCWTSSNNWLRVRAAERYRDANKDSA